MRIAREFEKRLERLVDGISAAVFRGRMHPVDLANRLIRHADLAVVEGAAGPEIPNEYVVTVSAGELDAGIDLHDLERELAGTLGATARYRGWRTRGPLRVEMRPVDRPSTGSINCTATAVPGPLPPWGQLVEVSGARSFDVADNRVLIGRSPDTDVALDEPEVSRHHAVLFREADTVWLTDLMSSNGTARNGIRLGDVPVSVVPGDALTFGPATFTFRLL